VWQPVAGHRRRMILNHVRRGDGAPLVLVHGLGGSLRSWDLVVDGLAAHREVVALDLPGFGASPPLPETTMTSLADAVALFLSAQGLQRADLVGTSLGGGSCWRWCAATSGGTWWRWIRAVTGTVFDSPDETVRVVLEATA
jgi:pimeloyl-ACP methyl ester carboxylesterase